GSLSQHEVQHCADADEHHQREHKILLNTACLNGAQLAAKPVGCIRRTVTEEAVDDRQIEVISNRGTNTLCARPEEMQDAVDDALIQELVNDVLGKPVNRFDKDGVIHFIEVVFSLQEINLEFVFRDGVNSTIYKISEPQATESNHERCEQRNPAELHG